jgi:transposase-like protein
MSLVERNGEVRSIHLPSITGDKLTAAVQRHVSPQSYLVTDGARFYRNIGWRFADHQWVNHGEREYVRGDVHTNTVEGYFSILKRGVYGVFHHVSEAHLHRYLSEFDFRYNTRERLGVDDTERASLTVVKAKGKRLTYETTRRPREASAGSATA